MTLKSQKYILSEIVFEMLYSIHEYQVIFLSKRALHYERTSCPLTDLMYFSDPGVLLLNACLTVTGGAANSHAGRGWEKLTDAAIRWLNSNTSGIVFMLWGSYAQKKGAFIDKVVYLGFFLWS